MGKKIVSFTCNIKNKDQFFISRDVFNIFESILLNELSENDCESLIHLFMPEYLHLVLEGKNEDSNVINAVNMFKQKTGFWICNNSIQIKWQKDYHDHIIRNNEDLKNHIDYILCNPVRAKIYESWQEYPFKGSTVYDFNKWK
ncbi:MAG: hypothetical protein WAT71_12055 [Ignavibacteria bacterium]